MIRNPLTASALLLPASLMVVGLLCLPLLLMLRYSFNSFVPGQFMVEAVTVRNYVKFFSDPYYLAVLKTTVQMSLGVTVFCLVLGMPLAAAVARASGRWKTALLLMVILPLFVSNAVRAAGWMVAFGQKGLINHLLLSAGLIDAPLTMMYTPLAVFLGIASVNLPYVVLTLQSVLEGIEPNAADASLSLGATPFETWRLITLPLAMPGILAAGVLSFILAMNAYATPVLLGGPSFQMMAPVVYNEVVNQNNWPFGATVSFVLMAVTLALTVVANLVVARRYAR